MKRLAVILLMFISMNTFAQEAPKSANVVIVKGITFDDVVKYFLIHSYQLDKIDRDFEVMTTKPFTPRRCACQMITQVVVKDSAAYISSTMTESVGLALFQSQGAANATASRQVNIVENRGMRGSDLKIAFNAMDALAKGLGGEVSYQIQ